MPNPLEQQPHRPDHRDPPCVCDHGSFDHDYRGWCGQWAADGGGQKLCECQQYRPTLVHLENVSAEQFEFANLSAATQRVVRDAHLVISSDRIVLKNRYGPEGEVASAGVMAKAKDIA